MPRPLVSRKELGRLLEAMREADRKELAGLYFRPILAQKQAINRRPVDFHVFALGYRQHEHHQNVSLNLINQPVALPEQLDLVAITQVTAQFSAWRPWLLQAFQQQLLKTALTLPSSAFHSVSASGKNLRR